jgi:hypothetical protein
VDQHLCITGNSWIRVFFLVHVGSLLYNTVAGLLYMLYIKFMIIYLKHNSLYICCFEMKTLLCFFSNKVVPVY